MTQSHLARQWIAGCTIAEAAGIAVVATVYGMTDRGHLAPGAPYVLGAGAVEGLSLGTAQALVMRGLGARGALWIMLTVLGAVAGYGLSLLAGAGGGSDTGATKPALWLMALAGAGAGLAMGLVMGLVQAPALPATLHTGRWVLANALGWAPAMAAIMLGAASVAPDWPLSAVALTGGASGAAAGAAVGLATLWGLSPALPAKGSTP